MITGLSDPYVITTMTYKSSGSSFRTLANVRTKTIKQNLNPVFNENFEFKLPHGGFPDKFTIKFEVFDWDRVGSDDPLGEYVLDDSTYSGEMLINEPMFFNVELQNIKTGTLHFEIMFREESRILATSINEVMRREREKLAYKNDVYEAKRGLLPGETETVKVLQVPRIIREINNFLNAQKKPGEKRVWDQRLLRNCITGFRSNLCQALVNEMGDLHYEKEHFFTMKYFLISQQQKGVEGAGKLDHQIEAAIQALIYYFSKMNQPALTHSFYNEYVDTKQDMFSDIRTELINIAEKELEVYNLDLLLRVLLPLVRYAFVDDQLDVASEDDWDETVITAFTKYVFGDFSDKDLVKKNTKLMKKLIYYKRNDE